MTEYVHYFNRYFDFDGNRIDRLEQIKKLGILSPRKAKELNVPYVQECKVTIKGVEGYDDVIFLYPANRKSRFADTSIRLSSALTVVTSEEMMRRCGNRWIVLTPYEVYAFGRIDPKYFIKINE